MTPEHEIARIALAMVGCTLPKPEWTHRAHFAAALWLLAHPDVLAREGGMASLIRRYNDATGTPNTATSGYHETITLASLRGAAAVRESMPGAPLGKVLDSLMAGALGDKHWPLAYWTEARLMSPEARANWVEPDCAPLPWPPLALMGKAV